MLTPSAVSDASIHRSLYSHREASSAEQDPPDRGRVGDAEQHSGRKQGYALNLSPGGSLACPPLPPDRRGLGSLAPHIGDPGPSDSALAAASSWRRRRPAADRQAAPCTFVGFEYLQLPWRKSVPPQSLLCREEPLLEVRQWLARDMVFRATSVYL